MEPQNALKLAINYQMGPEQQIKNSFQLLIHKPVLLQFLRKHGVLIKCRLTIANRIKRSGIVDEFGIPKFENCAGGRKELSQLLITERFCKKV